MSTQAAQSILLTHTSPQQGFRLLELTPELADLLSSKDAPPLQLKSPSPRSLPTDSTSNPDFINLCTPSQTYQIRQVQSSNSIHVIRPSDAGVHRGDITIVAGEGETNELNLVDTMTSIAKCASTLELHSPAEGFSAGPFLMRMLRVYDRVDNEDWVLGGTAKTKSGSGGGADEKEREHEVAVTRRVFGDVPVSLAQCERGWVELCAFVVQSASKLESETWCRRPSAQVKVDVWKRMLEGAVLQGIDLEKQFLVRDLWKSVLDEGEEPFPRTLFEAVVRRVSESEGDDGPGQLFADAQMKWASIDKQGCTRWVGETCLEAMAPSSGSAIGRKEFLTAWKDSLPESWRDEATFSKLTDGSYMHPDPTTVCYVNEVDRHKLKKNLSSDASNATAAKKSRNWHEFFKNKRQKR